MPTNPPVFVYGTLRRGGSNHFRMDGCQFIAGATARGALYQIDWYPGVVLDANGDTITGELYQSEAAQLAALDDYEGDEYRRVLGRVTDEHGSPHDAWIWEWRLPTTGLTRVSHGDWLAATPHRQQ